MKALCHSRALSRIFLATAFGLYLFEGAAQAQKPGGSITVGLELDIPGFDPLKVGVFDTAALTAAAALFDTLTYLDDKGVPQPKLAVSWNHSDDFKTWTFKLRPGVKFHDGTPFNAEAAKANFDRQKDPAIRRENDDRDDRRDSQPGPRARPLGPKCGEEKPRDPHDHVQQ